MQLAVFLRDAENLLLRLVAVLALPESVSPFAKHRRLPGQFAIAGDNLVEIGAIEKVVVDGVGYFGTEYREFAKRLLKRLREALFQKMP